MFHLPTSLLELLVACYKGEITEAVTTEFALPHHSLVTTARHVCKDLLQVYCPNISADELERVVHELQHASKHGKKVELYTDAQAILYPEIPNCSFKVFRCLPVPGLEEMHVIIDNKLIVSSASGVNVYPVQNKEGVSRMILLQNDMINAVCVPCDVIRDDIKELHRALRATWGRMLDELLCSRKLLRPQLDCSVQRYGGLGLYLCDASKGIQVLSRRRRLSTVVSRMTAWIDVTCRQNDFNGAELIRERLDIWKKFLYAPLPVFELVGARCTNPKTSTVPRFMSSTELLQRKTSWAPRREYDAVNLLYRRDYKRFMDLLNALLPKDIVLGEAAEQYAYVDRFGDTSVYFSNPVGLMFCACYRPSIDLREPLQRLTALKQQLGEAQATPEAVWKALCNNS